MTYNQAVTLIRQHGWEPNYCTVGGTEHNRCHEGSPYTVSAECETFFRTLGHEGDYKLSEVMNWLGY